MQKLVKAYIEVVQELYCRLGSLNFIFFNQVDSCGKNSCLDYRCSIIQKKNNDDKLSLLHYLLIIMI